jgi:hypothetical protein
MALTSGDLVGTKNGVNVIFTLPVSLIAGSEQIIHRGKTLKVVTSSPGADQCTINGQTVTLGTAPQSNEDLWYFGDSAA